MGEAMLVRRGSAKQKVEVIATTVNLGTFNSTSAMRNTNVSVSDLQNPEIGKNVFITLSSLTNRTKIEVNSSTVTATYSISSGYVYAKFIPSVSTAYLELQDVYVTVYKVYT